MLNELRQSVRSVLRNRTFTVMALACIALGIAVTSTIFSAVNAVLLRPLPYPEGDRLVIVFGENPQRGYDQSNISYPDYASWAAAKSFTELGVFQWTSTGFLAEGGAERINGADASTSLMRVLGVQPLLGRMFTDEEEKAQTRVVLLGHGLWQRMYGGDRSILGRTIKLSGVEHTVIGVMPASFSFPYQGEFWRPFRVEEWMLGRGNRALAGAVGRLKPGVTFEAANAELLSLSKSLEQQFPESNRGWQAQPFLLRENLIGDLGPSVLLFFGAVTLVLIIACANVANLLLARGLNRQRELAVRLAIGASRGRVIRQLLTESIVLAVFGGMLGTLLAFWGVDLLRRVLPENTPSFIQLDLDAPVLGFTIALSLLTGLIFGVVPALQSTRTDIQSALKQGVRNTSGVGRARLRNGLVVTEIALSVLLLIGGALTMRSLLALAAIDPGFDVQNVATMRVSLPGPRYPEDAQALAFYSQLFDRIRAFPGVTSVGAARGIPYSGWNVGSSISFEGRPAPPPGQHPSSHGQRVTPDFFKTMGVPILNGRGLLDTDRENAPRVAVVNEAFARKFYPGQNVVGKRVRWSGDDDSLATIVGVAADYRHFNLREPMEPAIYMPYAQYPVRQLDVVARTTADPAVLASDIRRLIADMDREVTVGRQQTLEQAVGRETAVARLQRNLVGVFSGLALMLALVGMYGVISYNVAQRNREIGVRVALGATSRDVLRLVLGEGARLALFGIVLGSVGALVAARSLTAMFWGVKPADPVTFTVVPLAVSAIAFVACLVPARRAAAIQPGLMLRGE
jgi:putative ABC transport system permease protein